MKVSTRWSKQLEHNISFNLQSTWWICSWNGISMCCLIIEYHPTLNHPPWMKFSSSNVGESCRTTTLGKEYTGTISSTNTGKTCQRWDSQTPHGHTRNDIADFPDGTLDDAANSCRNPDDEPGGPWCYTTDPASRWEYCDVPMCSGSCRSFCRCSISLIFNIRHKRIWHLIYLSSAHNFISLFLEAEETSGGAGGAGGDEGEH